MTRTERTLAADRAFNAQIDATMAELRAVAMPDISIFERGEYLAARSGHALPLPPGRWCWGSPHDSATRRDPGGMDHVPRRLCVRMLLGRQRKDG